MNQNRRVWMKKLLALTAGISLFKSASWASSPPNNTTTDHLLTLKNNQMKLGAFSISLTVKDLATSKQFYEQLGFSTFGGSMQQNYLIMKNEHALIGLFQGMFPNNILTFNPGWDYDAKPVEDFEDIRTIQKTLKSKGIKLDAEADETTKGPASIMLKDPDGNLILLDQHL